jgi:hypothetical protein
MLGHGGQYPLGSSASSKSKIDKHKRS